jgi:hypothetical protein
MKNIILSAISLAFVLTSCNQKNKEEETINSKTTETESPVVSQTSQDTINDVTETKPETTVPTANQSSFSTNEIVSDYLKLKNALVKDDSKAAANAGKKLLVTLNNTNANSLDAKSKKEYVDIADNAKEHTEHIGDNAGKIDHQREHFALLSKDINDFITTFGTTQKLYQDYCPMYDEGKSGYWISEIKEIKNPYYGSQMLTCGGIKKTY